MMEQLEYNRLFRRVVGLNMDGAEWQGRTAMRISISVSLWATTEDDVDRSLALILRIADEEVIGDCDPQWAFWLESTPIVVESPGSFKIKDQAILAGDLKSQAPAPVWAEVVVFRGYRKQFSIQLRTLAR
jgi:hypothetical protein